MHLHPHPAEPPPAIHGLEAGATVLADGRLRLDYQLDADLATLRLPAPATPAQRDGLWRQTCFEAFVAVAGDPAYCELNFSPAGEWAAYRFTGYRAGMEPMRLARVPAAHWNRSPRRLALEVTLDPALLLPVAAGAMLELALAAVVEEQSGTMSHWALRHPVARPDFHHRGGFALKLPAPVTAQERGS